MPTYEYICTSCHHEWEAEQRIVEAPLDTCPQCSQQTAKRQISGGNFILKGGGWYADLYSSPSKKRNGASKAESSGGSKPASTDPSSSASSDSAKPEKTKSEKSPSVAPSA